MTRKHWAIAVFGLGSAVFLNVQPTSAQNVQNNPRLPDPPLATATRPDKNPSGQTSLPNNAPPATTDRTTGQPNQDPTINQMNNDEKRKVDTEGK